MSFGFDFQTRYDPEIIFQFSEQRHFNCDCPDIGFFVFQSSIDHRRNPASGELMHFQTMPNHSNTLISRFTSWDRQDDHR